MVIDIIALVLVIIGALNWGSIGIFSFDLVSWICGGSGTLAARIIYVLVALAGMYLAALQGERGRPARGSSFRLRRGKRRGYVPRLFSLLTGGGEDGTISGR